MTLVNRRYDYRVFILKKMKNSTIPIYLGKIAKYFKVNLSLC